MAGQDITDEYYDTENVMLSADDPTDGTVIEPSWTSWYKLYSRINTKYSILSGMDSVLTGYYRYKKDTNKNQVQIQMKSITSTPWCFDIEFYKQTIAPVIKTVYYTEKDLSAVGEGNRIDLFCVSTYDRDANPTQTQTKFQLLDTALNTSMSKPDQNMYIIKCSEEKPLYIGSIFGQESGYEGIVALSNNEIMSLPWDETTNQLLVYSKWIVNKTNQFIYSQNERDLSNIEELFTDVAEGSNGDAAKFKKFAGLCRIYALPNKAAGFKIERRKSISTVYDTLYFIVYNA